MSDTQGDNHIDAWQGVPNPVVGWLSDSLYAATLNAYKPGMEIVWPPAFKLSEMSGTLVLTARTGTHGYHGTSPLQGAERVHEPEADHNNPIHSEAPSASIGASRRSSSGTALRG